MARAFAEIAFTPAVLAEQQKRGSDKAYAKFLDSDPDTGAAPADRIGPDEAAFIRDRDGFYQATVGEGGWPYVQFRGGPRGFLRVIDDTAVAYADFRGNRQYLSAGNLAADPRISLILMDYPNQRRLKLWGRARLVDAAEDPGLMSRLVDPEYRGRPERAVVIDVAALDWNCPQHIPNRFTLKELETTLAPVRAEMAALRAENAALKAGAPA